MPGPPFLRFPCTWESTEIIVKGGKAEYAYSQAEGRGMRAQAPFGGLAVGQHILVMPSQTLAGVFRGSAS